LGERRESKSNEKKMKKRRKQSKKSLVLVITAGEFDGRAVLLAGRQQPN
jgi:hypothetical protein